MNIIPVNKEGMALRMELSEEVFIPSVASTSLLFSVDSHDVKGKTIFDVGTGTGYLGLGLLLRQARYLYASDINLLAVEQARKNASLNGLDDRCNIQRGEYFEPFKDITVDCIVTNPPLMPSILERAAYGPNEATIAGDGSECLLEIIKKSPHLLAKKGVFYAPVFSFSNPEKVKETAHHYFSKVDVINYFDVIFDYHKLAQLEKFRQLFAAKRGYAIEHNDHPYWRIEILRCEHV